MINGGFVFKQCFFQYFCLYFLVPSATRKGEERGRGGGRWRGPWGIWGCLDGSLELPCQIFGVDWHAWCPFGLQPKFWLTTNFLVTRRDSVYALASFRRRICSLIFWLATVLVVLAWARSKQPLYTHKWQRSVENMGGFVRLRVGNECETRRRPLVSALPDGKSGYSIGRGRKRQPYRRWGHWPCYAREEEARLEVLSHASGCGWRPLHINAHQPPNMNTHGLDLQGAL